MRPLAAILRAMLAGAGRLRIARAAGLAAAAMLAGAALLALSGWLIVAAAMAGLAGPAIAAAFNVLQPAATIRALALIRTTGRYGERLDSHGLTLAGLIRLRVALLGGLLRLPGEQLARLRAPQALNRILADVEALDGLLPRVALPLLAGTLALTAGLATVGLLAGWSAALRIGLCHGGGAVIAVLAAGPRTMSAAARRGEAAGQALRVRVTDAMRAAEPLIAAGRLTAQRDASRAALTRRAAARAALDRRLRRGALVQNLATGAALAGTLALTPSLPPARAALALFAALALGETVAPILRGLAEAARAARPARRVLAQMQNPGSTSQQVSAPAPAPEPHLPHAPTPEPESPPSGKIEARAACCPVLALHDLKTPLARSRPLSLRVDAGETLAVTGPSGIGKSTLLAVIAGLSRPASGMVLIDGLPLPDWPEPALRDRLTMVPQRSALLPSTLRANLALAAPGASEPEMRAALIAVSLQRLVAERGLDTRLGGTLSGGEARRLALARAILRQPALLLLDEPTEGLDRDTAAATLRGLRASLPATAIVIATHHDVAAIGPLRGVALGSSGD